MRRRGEVPGRGAQRDAAPVEGEALPLFAQRTPAPQHPACTREWHEGLKTDDGRWYATTKNHRLHTDCDENVYDGGETHEYAECVRCNSTLARRR